MTPDEQAKVDQLLAAFADSWPPALYRFYTNCVNEGFDKDQAMILTLTIIKTVFGATK